MIVKLTHLDKTFWPKERYTKGDVIAYYEKIAPYLLPYLKNRAEALNRFPNGINGNCGQCVPCCHPLNAI
ncbi:hypothetical protein [Bradyrhizobium zhanjiangense]|uniref:DNA ligase D polymerase domain-containing protein n=1 Tax=Bradyrhizobium zhanjiangense TaxID=1325107 RepID=A0A4Q0QBN0_9BRAD|nr:hypothetical protein [Bradyrhizobium zhanjiangense]RXG87424.1 hypothetical protein EAS61_31375 [Bradyrhizobium zhanjiangense]